MKRWKWRFVLSIVNLIVALGMSALGAREWAADLIVHPQYFYHGNLYYSPIAQWLSYCLNAPSFYVVNLFGSFAMRYHLLPPGWFGIYCFYFVRYEYFLALFLFWWWVGWSVDMGLASHERGTSWTALVEALCGIVLSIALLSQGISDLRNSAVIYAIAVSRVVWGLCLLCYFVRLLWSTWSVGPQTQAK
jgi:hypothetical protein